MSNAVFILKRFPFILKLLSSGKTVLFDGFFQPKFYDNFLTFAVKNTVFSLDYFRTACFNENVGEGKKNFRFWLSAALSVAELSAVSGVLTPVAASR